MIYFTGDIHGTPKRVINFADKMQLTSKDTIVILGDVGANYFQDFRDDMTKIKLNDIGVTILCIHGNHEVRPANITSYSLEDWNGGKVWSEEKYPNLLFAKDGEIYTLEGMRYLTVGGAYSVDKFYRLAMNRGWWADEQPCDEIRHYVEKQITMYEIDAVLSHTCPLKFEPIEAFLPGIDQSRVDKSTEIWLDGIEERTPYKAWLCGHWHIDKSINNFHFLFNSWKSAADIFEESE